MKRDDWLASLTPPSPCLPTQDGHAARAGPSQQPPAVCTPKAPITLALARKLLALLHRENPAGPGSQMQPSPARSMLRPAVHPPSAETTLDRTCGRALWQTPRLQMQPHKLLLPATFCLASHATFRYKHSRCLITCGPLLNAAVRCVKNHEVHAELKNWPRIQQYLGEACCGDP